MKINPNHLEMYSIHERSKTLIDDSLTSLLPSPRRELKKLNIEIPLSIHCDAKVGPSSKDILRSPSSDNEKSFQLPKLTPKVGASYQNPNIRFPSPKRILKSELRCYNQPTYRSILSPEKASKYIGLNKTKETLRIRVRGLAKGPTYGGFYSEDNSLLKYIDRIQRSL
ncbi:unnamed protein product [Blepharisma stoltei]|uniref:Uncharacterized protein n=1 Tax=Blepharisma stoltei TaxID=1481888 RepID=A0AAU9JYY5_9CILI|nr:unnamed protein product [Blepharisma stoltei]